MSWEVVLGVTLPFIARGLTEHARARGAVPPRPLLLVIGDERVGFDMHASDSPSAGAIQVEMRSPGDLAGRDAGGRVTFATDHATMTHVFLGNVPPSELVGDGLATCSDHGTLPQLDAMFGPRPVVLNYNTHFFKAHFPG